DQVVPVAVVARQPRGLEHQHEADLAHAHLGRQALEAGAMRRGPPRAALVLVDDLDGSSGPAEREGALAQLILPLGALLVMLDLVRRRLADVDAGQALAVRALNLGRAHALVSSAVAAPRHRHA